jgi:hypothetical protein
LLSRPNLVVLPASVSSMARAAPTMSDDLFTEWLRELRGGRECPASVQAGLAVMVDNGRSFVTDIVTSVTSSDREGNQLVWAALLADAGKASPDEVGSVDVARALAWVLLPTELLTMRPHVVTPEAPPAPNPRGRPAENDGSAAAAAAMIEAAAPVAQTAAKRQVVSDLESQGASRVSDLVRLSCSVHMGRMASEEECAKATYGGHPGLSEGSRMMVKSKIPVLTTLIELAKAGEGGPLDVHMQGLVTSLLEEPGDVFAASSAARVISAWTQAKEVSTQYHEDSMAAGVYFGSFADKYINRCRGLPVTDDFLLMRAAERFADAKVKKGEGARRTSPGGKQAAAAPADTDALTALVAQVGEIASGMKEQQRDAKELRSRFESMASKVGRLGSEGGGGGRGGGKGGGSPNQAGRVCRNCNRTGHLAHECEFEKMVKKGAGAEGDDTEE